MSNQIYEEQATSHCIIYEYFIHAILFKEGINSSQLPPDMFFLEETMLLLSLLKQGLAMAAHGSS